MSSSPRRSVASDAPTGLRNLDNFLDCRIISGGRVLTSPRSVEVCLTHGVQPEELLPRPLESFQTGNTPRALVKRRFDHHEEKRLNVLAFLRSRRQELIANPPSVDSPVSRTSTPRAGSQRSSGFGSARRHRELQQRNFEERLQEEEARRRGIENTVAISIARAELARLEKQQQVRERGERRWADVHHHNQAAKQLEEASREAKREKLATNELKRETSKAAAATARGWRSADLAAANSKSVAEAQRRALSQEAEERAHHVTHWADIEEKAARAREAKEEQREQWAERGAHLDEELVAAKARADARLAEEIALRREKLAEKERRYGDHSKMLEDAQQAKEEARQREAERFNQTVERAAAVHEAKTELRRTKSAHKDARFLNHREELELQQLLERENKREKMVDHIEVVSRMKRARDYQRQKYLQQKYLGGGTN